jgi:hypothetical protein
VIYKVNPFGAEKEKPDQGIGSRDFSPVTGFGFSWCMSKMTISFFPFFSQGTGQFNQVFGLEPVEFA